MKAARPFLALLLIGVTAPPALAQVPTPTALPVPDVGGEWSISRTWFRQCPGCRGIVARTTPWIITQTGTDVRVNRGLTGSLQGTAGGGAWLTLEGLENGADGVLRFHYGSLKVAADGFTFSGGFSGSERIQNPCAPEPPIVTCFVSGGWMEARRLGTPVAVTPTLATASATAPPTPWPTTPPTAPSTPTVTQVAATPTPSDTPSPLPVAAFLPDCRRQLRP